MSPHDIGCHAFFCFMSSITTNDRVPHPRDAFVFAARVGRHEPQQPGTPQPSITTNVGCPTLATPLFLWLGWAATNPTTRTPQASTPQTSGAPPSRRLVLAARGAATNLKSLCSTRCCKPPTEHPSPSSPPAAPPHSPRAPRCVPPRHTPSTGKAPHRSALTPSHNAKASLPCSLFHRGQNQRPQPLPRKVRMHKDGAHLAASTAGSSKSGVRRTGPRSAPNSVFRFDQPPHPANPLSASISAKSRSGPQSAAYPVPAPYQVRLRSAPAYSRRPATPYRGFNQRM